MIERHGDDEIVALFFARSEKAIRLLSDKYGSVCYQLSHNILNNRLDAEECVNDAYLGVWNRVPPNQPNPLVTFLLKIVRNISIKRYHHNTAAKRNSHFDIALNEIENCLASPNTVDDAIFEKELVLLIENFLDGLPTEDRVIFLERYWFSRSITEIAGKHCITEHNAVVKLSRIRSKLRVHLEKSGVGV